MSSPGVGFEYLPKKVSWLKRDVLLFNISIGCREPHYVYELDENFAVFPTYPLALVFKLNNQEVIDFYSTQSSVEIPGVPKLDPSRLVDGQRTIQALKPLPVSSVGRDFEFQSKILGVYDKGKVGTVVRSEDVLVDAASGEAYARIIGSLFYIGQGGWNGPRGPKGAGSLPPQGLQPDMTLLFGVKEESAHLYRLNGDYNPLHATPGPGEKMGYGGIIMHGVFAYNCIAHEILKELGCSKVENFREMQARFSGVVKPGDQIQTDLWRMGTGVGGWDEIRWVARVVGTGKACLSDGRAVIRVEDPGTLSRL